MTCAILSVMKDTLSNDADNTTSHTCIIYYKLKLQEILRSYFAVLSPSDGYLQKGCLETSGQLPYAVMQRAFVNDLLNSGLLFPNMTVV